MKRTVIDDLIKWKQLNYDNPLLLTGAKGVGKTYLAYDFAKAFFEDIYYLNFEREPGTKDLFNIMSQQESVNALSGYFHLKQEKPIETRILILDEVHCCLEAMNMIKAGQLQNIFRYIITISSNPLPNECKENVTLIPVYPLEFDEFLKATGNDWYIDLIVMHFQANKSIPEIVHTELLALHELYLQIGGMPGIINEYLNMSSVVNVSEQHSSFISSYHDGIIRDYKDNDALKMNQVFDSLVYQLMKDNKKFQYKLIRKGTTHSMYKDSIQRLSDLNYVIKCNRISNEQLMNPIQTFHSEDWNSIEANTNFKLYMPDTGMLYTKMVEEQGPILNHNLKKALLENYVARSLQTKNYPFAFWESDSMAKIDFIISNNQTTIPIEIFENDNTRSKSISIIKQKLDFPYSIKISTKNFEYANQIKYVPYYAVFCL